MEKLNEVSIEELSDIMIELQNKKLPQHRIGFSNTLCFPILKSIKIAKDKGLILPIIYNTNGYDSVEVLKAL